MWLDLGCNLLVNGFQVRNTHGSLVNSYSTARLKVELRSFETYIQNELIKEDLPDSRDQVNSKQHKQIFVNQENVQECNVPLLEYDVSNIDQKKRIGSDMKVSIESFHQHAWGGGLLYFGVDADLGK